MPVETPVPEGLPSDAPYKDMEGFLKLRKPFTILPTPLPSDSSSELNDLYFTDSLTQDQTAVMDACLHNCMDVPRAQRIFNQLRVDKPESPALSTKIFNSFLNAYLRKAGMATAPKEASMWMTNALSLFEEMESNHSAPSPDVNSYAQLLLAWQRHNLDSATPITSDAYELPNPKRLLLSLVDRNISVTQLVSDRAFTTSDDAHLAIRELSKAAVELNMSKVVNELGMADAIGRQTGDPLEGIPEATPVLRLKVCLLPLSDTS